MSRLADWLLGPTQIAKDERVTTVRRTIHLPRSPRYAAGSYPLVVEVSVGTECRPRFPWSRREIVFTRVIGGATIPQPPGWFELASIQERWPDVQPRYLRAGVVSPFSVARRAADNLRDTLVMSRAAPI